MKALNERSRSDWMNDEAVTVYAELEAEMKEHKPRQSVKAKLTLYQSGRLLPDMICFIKGVAKGPAG